MLPAWNAGCQCSSVVEQRFRKPSVVGSNPTIGSKPKPLNTRRLQFSKLQGRQKVLALLGHFWYKNAPENSLCETEF
jgi:hypothetical protein